MYMNKREKEGKKIHEKKKQKKIEYFLLTSMAFKYHKKKNKKIRKNVCKWVNLNIANV